MENFYFPLFLVVLAAVVIWAFSRSRRDSARNRRRSSRSSGRLVAHGHTHQTHGKRLGPAARVQSGAGRSTRGDIFQPRKERVHKESFSQSASRGVYHAGYIAPDAHATGSGAGEIREQDVSEAEHLSMDEYLAKRERERAKRAAEEAAEKESGVSMTAIKYESDEASGAAPDKEDGTSRKSASFKP